MQLSRAQHSADVVLDFIREASNGSHFALTTADKSSLARPKYISDWLYLWLICGEGHQECDGDFGRYMQVVALLFAEYSMNQHLFPAEMGLLPPTPTEFLVTGFDEMTLVTEQQYLLPASLTLEGFTETRNLTEEERSNWIKTFLAEPARRRYGVFVPSDAAE